LVCFILLSTLLSGCTFEHVRKIRLSGEQAYYPEAAPEKYRITDTQSLSSVYLTSSLELLFDSQTACIAVRSNKSGESSYCASSYADKFGLSYVLSVRIAGADGRSYYLNSRDNSVVFGAIKKENIENGISVTYSLALNTEDALCKRQSLKKEALRADITLLFELEDNSLCVSIDCSDMFISEGYIIEKLRLLPGLACGNAEKESFFLLPDGCGVLADISGKAAADADYMYYCFGPDVSSGEKGAKAYLPFFAFKYGESAVCATVEDGDAMAAFNYQRKTGLAGAAVFPEFTITSFEQTEKHLFTGITYGGEIKVRYTFIVNGKNDYTDIATVCRERLVRSSALPAGTLNAQSSMPFLLIAVGALSGSRSSSHTEFIEAKEMLSILKAKGIDNIVMRYMGTLSGGLDQQSISSARFLKMLGNKNDLTALTDYARVQNLEVFFDIDLISERKNTALTTFSGGETINEETSINSVLKAENNNSHAAPLKNLKNNVSAALSLLEDRNVSLVDVSESLYSDVSYGLTRQGAKEYINESCRAFGANRSIMLSEPALYLLKGAKYVSSLPISAGVAYDGNITAIPFLQIVLHGTIYYAGEPLNFSGDLEYSVLKCAEYGCMPSAVLMYRSVRADYITYYVTQSPKLAAIYEKMNAELSDLFAQRITGHTKVQEGVYCTEYGNTSLVYVNYTSSSVEINGLTLEAGDYMRVN